MTINVNEKYTMISQGTEYDCIVYDILDDHDILVYLPDSTEFLNVNFNAVTSIKLADDAVLRVRERTYTYDSNGTCINVTYEFV